MAVAFQHGPAHVAHQSKHGGFGNARFRKACGEGVPEVMQTAGHAGILPQFVPSLCDIRGVPRRGKEGACPKERDIGLVSALRIAPRTIRDVKREWMPTQR